MSEEKKPRRLIICCDGTGNEIKENQSNVLKFYKLLKKDEPNQIGYYDVGIGTISDSGAWGRFKNRTKGVIGLAFGYGLDENVLDAYRFLIENYRKGDQIYLLGFSRGAYTVRVLAGLIHMCGLLHPHQANLASYALTIYKRAGTDKDEGIAYRLQEMMDTMRPTIHFMGCWDTVSSILIPRPDRGGIPTLQELPNTDNNPSVRHFRHAMAIDERRRMFRVARWEPDQIFKYLPYIDDEQGEPQIAKQVWFAGVHSDIGGGYTERDSGAAKFPLQWMVDEARDCGLVFREVMVKRLVRGENPSNVEEGGPRDYTAPDATAKLHNSMVWLWPILEVFPKSKKRHDNPAVREGHGIYWPLKERRYIEPGSVLHSSVLERMEKTGYAPVNLPPEN
ncbi:DUF2235 domain-containing protein [Ahrensia sp. R2A130]|uniref:DUF2235 domain-containing protein n=1 Tax=Ahrensia sp. R2A130 TaxID=744979 RepID=UPI0001E08451|nr:DUF2235 domain-containing protein [Ahrensia sp. R2A130]EFL87446.1 hypothetical protein R2A130_3614 [Ahrensia sp. R2A130]